jgi:hypothetical protein
MSTPTHRIDRVHELAREVEEELGSLKDAKSGAKFLRLDGVLKDG